MAGSAELDPFPVTSQVVGALRKTDDFKTFVSGKMSLGSRGAADLGNLYTAALPAWIAAGLEEALTKDIDLAEKRLLALGYGSGDAAESIPLRVVPNWKDSAKRIGFGAALEHAADLTQAQYESLHDARHAIDLPKIAGDRFRIASVGEKYDLSFQDLAVEYYEYVR
jgi:hydroxymethylglutaryl-CoA synthase